MDDQIPWGWRKIPLLLHTFSLFWIADRLTATLNKHMSRSRLSRDTGRTWRVTSLLLCQAVIGCQVREVRCSKMHLQPLRNRFTSKCNQCRCCKVKKKKLFCTQRCKWPNAAFWGVVFVCKVTQQDHLTAALLCMHERAMLSRWIKATKLASWLTMQLISSQ